VENNIDDEYDEPDEPPLFDEDTPPIQTREIKKR
jgi:hypothetical protein